VLAILAPGEVRVTEPGGNVIRAQAEDGFLSMQADTVTIVAGVVELVG
jgi:F-type H+-transporting ATPase subunit epsilon